MNNMLANNHKGPNVMSLSLRTDGKTSIRGYIVHSSCWSNKRDGGSSSNTQ